MVSFSLAQYNQLCLFTWFWVGCVLYRVSSMCVYASTCPYSPLVLGGVYVCMGYVVWDHNGGGFLSLSLIMPFYFSYSFTYSLSLQRL